GSRVLPQGEVADLGPCANRAPLGLEENLEDRRRAGVGKDLVPPSGALTILGARKVGIRATGTIGERADVVGNRPAELVDPRRDELEVGPVLQARVLANLLVVLLAGQVHAEDRVVVVGGELSARGVD